jgi:putative SOS response-associated peptidase YedK
MGGRYKLSRGKLRVEEYFDSGSDEPDWTPRFNIAPTQPAPVIRQNPSLLNPIRVVLNLFPQLTTAFPLTCFAIGITGSSSAIRHLEFIVRARVHIFTSIDKNHAVLQRHS